MTRREALAALVAMPAVTRIAASDVRPGDVIVLECDHPLSEEAARNIRVTLESVWPGRRCVVLAKGMTLKVVSQ